MKLVYKPSYSSIIYENPDELKKLQELNEKNAILKRVWNPFSKSYEFDKIYLLKKGKNNSFYCLSGLLPLFEIDYPKVHLPLLDREQLEKDAIWELLRDYQKESINKLLENPRGILQAPTGSGKTFIIIALAKAIKSQYPILVIVPKTQSLLEQTIDNFLKFFPETEIGWTYGKGQKYGRIMISSPAYLSRHPLDYYPVVLIDECHATPSSQIALFLLQHKKNTLIRYGFSGTPIGRSDERDYVTYGLIGTITHKISHLPLVQQNYLSPFFYLFIWFNSQDFYLKHEDLDQIIQYSDSPKWNDLVNHLIMHNPVRTQFILNLLRKLHQHKRNCLIIVERKEHGRILEKLIKEQYGLHSVRLLTSETKNNYQHIQEFKQGKYPFLIATQLIETGIDIPNLNSIIIASIGKSSIQLLQRLGRGLRFQDNKKLLVFDLVERANPIFIKHASQRYKSLQQTYQPVRNYLSPATQLEDIPKEVDHLWQTYIIPEL